MVAVEQPRRARPRSPWYLRRELHLAAGLAVAALTVVFAAERAAAGARAALDARLLNAGAGANAALVAVESEQLSTVRAIAFTRGVAAALAAHDGPRLNTLVAPLQANSTVPMVDVVEPDGRVLLAVRTKGAPPPVGSRRGLRALTEALRDARGSLGGRLTELAIFRSGPTLVTISPVAKDARPAGAVLAMTPLADALGRLSEEVGADLTAYDPNGRPLATTAPFDPSPLRPDVARALVGGGPVVTRSLHGEREKLGRLIVDHAPDAVLGVSLADTSARTGRAVGVYTALGLVCAAIILATFWARVRLRRP